MVKNVICKLLALLLASCMAACDMWPLETDDEADHTPSAQEPPNEELDEPFTAHLPQRAQEHLRFKALSSGGYFRTGYTCGVTMDNEAYCWGSNRHGELGNGTTANEDVPFDSVATKVVGNLSFASISTGRHHTCGISTEGIAYCWGSNESGQLGMGGVGFPDRTSAPIPVDEDLFFSAISAGRNHTCAITPDGVAYCWGNNHQGQLGRGYVTWDFRTRYPAPEPVNGELRFTAISAGSGWTCGITAENELHCWGFCSANEESYCLGSEPTPMGSDYVAVDASSHICALTGGGAAYCMGLLNWSGALGTGQGGTPGVFGPVQGEHRFTSITVGDSHSCGITESKEVYCWGSNADGQLGIEVHDDTGPGRCQTLRLGWCPSGNCSNRPPSYYACSSTPVKVPTDLNFEMLTAGGYHTCGLTEAGEAYCWGRRHW